MSIESQLNKNGKYIGGDDDATPKQRKDRKGPFLQFERCKVKDCNYYNENGTCMAETCVYAVEKAKLAPSVLYRCKMCNQLYSRNPQYNDIQLCDTCLKRMQSVEAPPFTCAWCGSSVGKRPSIPFFKCCDSCIRKFKLALEWEHPPP